MNSLQCQGPFRLPQGLEKRIILGSLSQQLNMTDGLPVEAPLTYWMRITVSPIAVYDLRFVVCTKSPRLACCQRAHATVLMHVHRD